MNTSTVVVKVERPCFIEGQCRAAGSTVKVDAADAGDLLRTGRAVLVDPSEWEAVRLAVEVKTARTMKQLGPAPSGPRPDYWQKVAH
jgi:hypothetical protein